jgi:hypothetical protein
MTIKEVTFSIEKTTPLMPLTGDPADQYSNVKPRASCTITLANDSELDEAFQIAQDSCFDQLAKFHADFVAAFGK